MDVYLVPTGRGRFALYFEAGPPLDPTGADVRGRGVWHGLVARFRSMLAAVERGDDERESAPSAAPLAAPARPSIGQRLKARLLRWLSTRVAEQRLLWHLRGERGARLHAPADLAMAEAQRSLRAILKRDADRHLAWCVGFAAAFALSGLVAVLPGPNVIAYYFAFRLVGHYLSARGARHGLHAVDWSIESNAALGDLGRLCDLPPSERASRVHAAADALGLRRLPEFFARTASPVC